MIRIKFIQHAENRNKREKKQNLVIEVVGAFKFSGRNTRKYHPRLKIYQILQSSSISGVSDFGNNLEFYDIVGALIDIKI